MKTELTPEQQQSRIAEFARQSNAALEANRAAKEGIAGRHLAAVGGLMPNGDPADQATIDSDRRAMQAEMDIANNAYGQAMETLYQAYPEKRPAGTAQAAQAPTAAAPAPAAGPTPTGGQGAQPHPVGSILAPEAMGIPATAVAKLKALAPGHTAHGPDNSVWTKLPNGMIQRTQ